MLPRVAWILAGATLVLVVVDTVVSAQSVSLTSETAVAVHGFPFVHGAVLGSAVMGALIISRYERHPIGWLLALVGVTSAISLLTEAYAFWVQEADGPGSDAVAGVASWLSALLGGQLAIAGMALMFLLAPDGRLVSRRWRYAAWAVEAGALLCVAAVASMNPTTVRLLTTSEHVGPVRRSMLTIGFLAIIGGLVASVVSMLQRLRRSSGEQRQQLRLIALSAALVAAGIVCLVVVEAFNGDQQTWLGSLPLFVAYFLLPILFAVAVLRHRLYDLDVIINRSVVVLAGTAFAALGYATLVVSVGKLVEGRTGGFWISLLATAVVALAFQPVRRQVVRLSNRVAYGSRAQPYEELADFSRRLTEMPSAETLLPAVAAAAGQALAARRATATLSVADLGTSSGSWGPGSPGATDLHTASVTADGVVLGEIAVAIPKGRPLRASDARLLRALADQAAVAFRNAAMETQLAGHVAELDRRTHELAGSRSRIIEADDAVRRTLEGSISRDVLPHLVTVRHALGRTRVTGEATTSGTGELIDEVNAALESLRELTRGVFPTQLARTGVEPALRSFLARNGLPTTLSVDESLAGARFSARVEAAVYFCCTQAASALPRPTSIELGIDGAELRLEVRGVTSLGVDLPGIVDRVEAAGGSLTAVDHGLVLSIPVEVSRPGSDQVSSQAADHAAASRSGPNAAFATYAVAPDPARSNWSSS